MMFKRSFTAAAAALLSAAALAGPLQPGDVFVYRVGDGSAALSSAATAVFLDEYSAAGALVQSIALSAGASFSAGLTASGTATSEGLLTLSADQRYVMLAGYGATLGTAGIAATTATAAPRVVGRIEASTGNVDTSTRLTNFSSGNNIRGVASTDGNNIWVSGASTGVAFTSLGNSTATAISTTVTNIRGVEIAAEQLYTSTGSGSAVRVGSVGTGTPTTAGQTITNLPGLSASTGSPYAFYFADLSSSVAGVDTLYVADDNAAGGTAAGISKYSLVGGNWVSNGTVGVAADGYRGLTGGVFGSTVSLYATSGSKLVALTDTGGYNASFASTITTLATAAANTAFRGVAFLPAAVPEPGTYALWLAGLTSVALVVRRKRRA